MPTVQRIARVVEGKVNGNESKSIEGIATLDRANDNELSFLTRPEYYTTEAINSSAGAILIDNPDILPEKTTIIVDDVQLGYARAMRFFYSNRNEAKDGIHEDAFVGEDVELNDEVYLGPGATVKAGCKLGKGTSILAGATIMGGAEIGSECLIKPGAVVHSNVLIKDNVIIGSGSIIGSEGFGFYIDGESPIKIPQTGSVIIEANVEIGSNCTVDKATLNETVIGKGTKIDSLVLIGHNASIGNDSIIIGQSGISGSASVGDNCLLMGQVGVRGHVSIGDNAEVLGKSGVRRDVQEGETVGGGLPALPHILWKRIIAILKKLPDHFHKL